MWFYGFFSSFKSCEHSLSLYVTVLLPLLTCLRHFNALRLQCFAQSRRSGKADTKVGQVTGPSWFLRNLAGTKRGLPQSLKEVFSSTCSQNIIWSLGDGYFNRKMLFLKPLSTRWAAHFMGVYKWLHWTFTAAGGSRPSNKEPSRDDVSIFFSERDFSQCVCAWLKSWILFTFNCWNRIWSFMIV